MIPEEHCPQAQLIIARDGEGCFDKSGGRTAFSYHIEVCKDCAKLRDQAAAKYREMEMSK